MLQLLADWAEAESDDWEEMLESLGVARRVRGRKGGLRRAISAIRCGYCGLRLPLDASHASFGLAVLRSPPLLFHPLQRDRSLQSSSTRNAALAPGRTVQPAEAKSNEQE